MSHIMLSICMTNPFVAVINASVALGRNLSRNRRIPFEILLLRGDQFFDLFQVETARPRSFNLEEVEELVAAEE